MDHDLVQRARGGDQAAFTALATASIARLHRTARLILRDDDRAADAVQDALVAAWLDIRAVRDPDRFDAWLNRILVRACYREAGRRRRHQVVEILVQPPEEAVDRDRSRDVEVRDQLDRAFRRLTPDHRAALVVHHYLGLPDAGAAEVLGIPLGTFKSRFNRATIAMRAAIEADERIAARPRESLT